MICLSTDLDECDESSTNSCHPNATCINSIGSFLCSCLDGFTGDGVNCSGKVQLH